MTPQQRQASWACVQAAPHVRYTVKHHGTVVLAAGWSDGTGAGAALLPDDGDGNAWAPAFFRSILQMIRLINLHEPAQVSLFVELMMSCSYPEIPLPDEADQPTLIIGIRDNLVLVGSSEPFAGTRHFGLAAAAIHREVRAASPKAQQHILAHVLRSTLPDMIAFSAAYHPPMERYETSEEGDGATDETDA